MAHGAQKAELWARWQKHDPGSAQKIDHSAWGATLFIVEGEKLSLDDIEHRILRPIWKDNRVHYAVNAATLGSPNLQPLAFTSENSEALLEKGAREFVNHRRGVSLEKGRLQ